MKDKSCESIKNFERTPTSGSHKCNECSVYLHVTQDGWCIKTTAAFHNPCVMRDVVAVFVFVTIVSSQRIFVDDFCDNFDRKSHRVWFGAELTAVFETRHSPWRWFVVVSLAMTSASCLLLQSDCFNNSTFKTTPSRDVTPQLMTSRLLLFLLLSSPKYFHNLFNHWKH